MTETHCPHCGRRMVPLGPYPLACASLKCAFQRIERMSDTLNKVRSWARSSGVSMPSLEAILDGPPGSTNVEKMKTLSLLEELDIADNENSRHGLPPMIIGARLALERITEMPCSCDHAPCSHEEAREYARGLLKSITP